METININDANRNEINSVMSVLQQQMKEKKELQRKSSKLSKSSFIKSKHHERECLGNDVFNKGTAACKLSIQKVVITPT